MTNRSDDDNDDTYKVGYKNPPKKNQFKPGQSGNPSGGHRKRKLNKLEREEKQAAALREKEAALANAFKKVALEEQEVLANGSRSKMSAHEVIMRQTVSRAMKKDADPRDRRLYFLLAGKVGLLDKASPEERSGVLVIYSPMQLAEWEAATEGQLLTIDPLEGIPGAQGVLDEPLPRVRLPPEPDD